MGKQYFCSRCKNIFISERVYLSNTRRICDKCLIDRWKKTNKKVKKNGKI